MFFPLFLGRERRRAGRKGEERGRGKAFFVAASIQRFSELRFYPTLSLKTLPFRRNGREARPKIGPGKGGRPKAARPLSRGLHFGESHRLYVNVLILSVNTSCLRSFLYSDPSDPYASNQSSPFQSAVATPRSSTRAALIKRHALKLPNP